MLEVMLDIVGGVAKAEPDDPYALWAQNRLCSRNLEKACIRSLNSWVDMHISPSPSDCMSGTLTEKFSATPLYKNVCELISDVNLRRMAMAWLVIPRHLAIGSWRGTFSAAVVPRLSDARHLASARVIY